MDIGRLFRVKFDERMHRLGLSRSEWWLLAHLWFFEGMNQQELAVITDMTKGGVAKLVARLEAKGLIERRGCARDGRATKQIFLTPEGRPLARRVDRGARQLVRSTEATLRADEISALHESLRTVRRLLLKPDR
jgi:DNA-binding MarR family transcriptional regulator